MFLPELQAELCQGDVIEGIEIVQPFAPNETTSFPLALLTNDCDIDKAKQVPHLLTVRVVPIAEVEKVNKGKAGDIRANRAAAAMPLEAHPKLPDHFIDFRYIHLVPRDWVIKAHADGRRIASMSEDGRRALFFWMHQFFTRKQKPREPGVVAPTFGLMGTIASEAKK